MPSQQSPSSSSAPSPKLAGLGVAVFVALASIWFRQQQQQEQRQDVPVVAHHTDSTTRSTTGSMMDDQMARIELEVANGWSLRPDAVPENLTKEERGRFALVADGSRGRTEAADPEGWYGKWRGVVPGGAAWDDSKIDDGTSDGNTSANDDGSATAEQFIREEVRSPWAVWTTGALLSSAECAAWIERAEALDLETGDFIFAGGSNYGLARISTGARRHSSTRLVDDEEFAALMTDRMADQGLPETLADGRKYGGIGSSFLVTKYEEGQYFAPHFDGRGSGGFYRDGYVAEFTVVLYLTDDFVGGATHYLPGQGSEVAEAVALRPTRGCAAVHRQGTVLHSGGAVLEGTKYIMQFFPYYEAPALPEPRPLTNLRWGA